MPTLSDKQGGQLLAVALLVLGRTWVSDRIADLNGASLQALTFVCMPLVALYRSIFCFCVNLFYGIWINQGFN